MHPLRPIVVAFAAALISLACASTNSHFEAAVPEQYANLPLASEEGIQPPKILRRADPVVSEAMRAEGRDRMAVVEAVIAPDGRVIDAYYVRGDREWGSAVTAAVRQWQFEPVTRNGEPLTVRYQITSKYNSVPGM